VLYNVAPERNNLQCFVPINDYCKELEHWEVFSFFPTQDVSVSRALYALMALISILEHLIGFKLFFFLKLYFYTLFLMFYVTLFIYLSQLIYLFYLS